MDAALQLSWDRSDLRTRLAYLLLLAGLGLWLTYTRFFWTLRPLHATLPACPFYLVTGHPCPLCGGTRSFATMWSGDVVGAARYYPLGPVLFVLSLGAIALLGASALSGRRIAVQLPQRTETRLYVVLVAVFGVSWILKLFWLGN